MIPLEVIALSPYAREWAAELARRSARRRFRDHLHRDIEIGEWEPGDSPALLALYRSDDARPSIRELSLFSEERRAVWLEQLLSRGPNVVARAAGRIVGHAALVAYDRGDSHELAVFVNPEYRGAGIAGALVDALLDSARRQGVDHIWLTVDQDNHRAASLYFSRGFRIARDDSAERTAAASWGVDVWTLALADITRRTASSWKDVLSAANRGRLRAVANALRLVMIPLVCAVVVAVASEDPRGRALAIVLAVVAVGFGFVVHRRAIIRGRTGGRVPNDRPLTTGEWMARVR
jgi:ribosomal protein S18 acetylase RimI-like enzyme